MRLASEHRILGITSTQKTRLEEDGVENRSEPHGWLADGSPGDTDPAQDADQSAGVKTALSNSQEEPDDLAADPGHGGDSDSIGFGNGSYGLSSSATAGWPSPSGTSSEATADWPSPSGITSEATAGWPSPSGTSSDATVPGTETADGFPSPPGSSVPLTGRD